MATTIQTRRLARLLLLLVAVAVIVAFLSSPRWEIRAVGGLVLLVYAFWVSRQMASPETSGQLSLRVRIMIGAAVLSILAVMLGQNTAHWLYQLGRHSLRALLR